MAKILEFRPPAPKPLSQEQILAQELTPKQAIDLIILGMLEVTLPKWIEREWPFKQLELMTNELRYAMEISVPEKITRSQVFAMVNHLRPSWEIFAEEIDPSYFW